MGVAGTRCCDDWMTLIKTLLGQLIWLSLFSSLVISLILKLDSSSMKF